MAEFLRTVFRSIVSKPVSNRVRASAKCNYSSSPVERYTNGDDDHHENDDAADDDKRQRLLKVAIVGVPNAGKSSLINSIVRRNVRVASETFEFVC